MNDKALRNAVTPDDSAKQESAQGLCTKTTVTVTTPARNGAKQSTAAGKPARKRGGAPPGNRNNLRHGLRAGQLPPGCSWIAATTAQLRTSLETAVLQVRGEVTIVDAAAINTATRCERHALLCQRLLRMSWDKLSFTERLSYSREITTASAARDKALERLGLDKLLKPSDPWAAADFAAASQTTANGHGTLQRLSEKPTENTTGSARTLPPNPGSDPAVCGTTRGSVATGRPLPSERPDDAGDSPRDSDRATERRSCQGKAETEGGTDARA